MAINEPMWLIDIELDSGTRSVTFEDYVLDEESLTMSDGSTVSMSDGSTLGFGV